MTRAFVLAIALVSSSPLVAAELVTLSGQRSTGSVVAITAQGVTLRDATGNKSTTPINEVATLELTKPDPAPLPNHILIELVDGSTLRATAFSVKEKAVGLTPLKPSVTFELPLATLYWVARSGEDAAAQKAFQAIVTGRGKRDLFVVKQASGLNPLPGTVIAGTVGGDAIVFEREDGRQLELKLSRATGGLVFNQPPRDVVPPTLCRVIDQLGNTLVAQSVVIEGTRVTVTTLAGCIVRYDSIDQLRSFDFAQRNVQYLTDLGGRADYPLPEDDGPLGKQFPFSPLVALDKAVGGGPIMFAGTVYPRGISVPPGVAINYPLGGKYREFRATIGITEGPTRQNGAMRLRLELDGRVVFDEVVNPADKPRELAIDIREAGELRVVVERAGAVLDGNQLNLADARVQK